MFEEHTTIDGLSICFNVQMAIYTTVQNTPEHCGVSSHGLQFIITTPYADMIAKVVS